MKVLIGFVSGVLVFTGFVVFISEGIVKSVKEELPVKPIVCQQTIEGVCNSLVFSQECPAFWVKGNCK